MSELVEATRHRNWQLLSALLEAGMDPNQVDKYGNTPLYWAAFKGYTKIVELLLKAGADPKHVNNNGNTPLYWAALEGYLKIVELLLKAGADPKHVNNNGNTPLYWATRNGYTKIVELLKSYKNKVSSLNTLCLRVIHFNENKPIVPGWFPPLLLEWNDGLD